MNALIKKLNSLTKGKTKHSFLIPFITAGDPSLAVTAQLIKVIEQAGAAALELGLPFSDPLADGPTIQASYQRALKKGVNLDGIFRMLKGLKGRVNIPLILMGYYNLIYHYGLDRFARMAKSCGVSGVIIPDLPPEEAGDWLKAAKRSDLCPIFLVSPVSSRARIKTIAGLSRGFIYYVSLTGVTGARARLSSDIAGHIQTIRRLTKKPVCVGFGISKPAQVKALSKIADGVIVGSALVKLIHQLASARTVSFVTPAKAGVQERVGAFIKTLANAAK